MHFENDKIYHVYNQGNNKQQIFFSPENYLYFLRCYRKFVFPFAHTLAYCLMPNHFHFLIHTDNESTTSIRVDSLFLSQLSNGVRKLLSCYATAINIQQHTSGLYSDKKLRHEY